MSVVTCFNHSTHPAKDHLIQAFLHHTDRSLNHLEFALSPFVEDYYASPVWEVINLPHIVPYSLVIRVLYSRWWVCQPYSRTFFSVLAPRAGGPDQQEGGNPETDEGSESRIRLVNPDGKKNRDESQNIKKLFKHLKHFLLLVPKNIQSLIINHEEAMLPTSIAPLSVESAHLTSTMLDG